jgi:bifunctional enzyme CysN/CysC
MDTVIPAPSETAGPAVQPQAHEVAQGTAPQPVSFLRFLTCGSVDDGKSTLIGRLLYDTKLVFEDQLLALASDSRKHGSTGDDMDFALLVDGLEAERQQGITIDVAYRFFTTERRRFIVADTPGHEQYTRNMATGASNAELAVVLVDARNGVLTQTRRHSFIASLLGIRHVVLAVNKIDLVDFSAARFDAIRKDYEHAVAGFGFRSLVAIPISARFGDNVIAPSERTPWYEGPCLLEHLETVAIDDEAATLPFRMPVQWVNRPNHDFRGYAGTIASGRIRPGEVVSVSGSERQVAVRRIVTMDGDRDQAEAGEAVTLVLAEETDVSRGDVLADAAAPVPVADQFAAHLVWLAEAPLLSGRSYRFKLGARSTTGSVTRIRHRIDVNTQEKLSADDLKMNDLGVVHLALTAPLPFAPYAESRDLGGFIVVDRLSNATVGVGMIDHALRRATSITWQELDVNKAARARLKEQSPCIVWFTGLSGSGKSTITNLVEKKLAALGRHTYALDGDNVRHGLNKDLGFTAADRVENIRRVAEAAALFVDAGLIVLVSFISPYRSERGMARERVAQGEFIEVFVDTPIEECRRRDPKGLYARADAGEIRNFTGIDAPYEAPLAPELHLRTLDAPPEALADRVLDELRRRQIVR